MQALIDGDIISHRIGFTTENDSENIAKYRCDEMLDGILVDSSSDSFTIYLSDSAENNFRYKIDPSYKANRVKLVKPKHYDFLKEHLIVNWGAEISYGMEADDSLGIRQNDNSIICSIDKDLLQIPGQHYNFVKKQFIEVSVEEGLLSFYRSIMIGDVSDNIKGIYGIGPAKATKILPKWLNPDDAITRIFNAYMDAAKLSHTPVPEVVDKIINNARLLKIKQLEDEPLWDSPLLRQMGEQMQLSMQQTQEASNPSTEPTSPEMKNSDGLSALGLSKDSSTQTPTELA